MVTTAATQSSDVPETVRPRLQWRHSELLIRLGLVAAAVAFAYCFRWDFLRSWTLEANAALDRLAGVNLLRISKDMVVWHGIPFRYENACTFVDVWFGSLPLLWTTRRGFWYNLLFVSLYTPVLFAFNIFRLSLSDVLFAHGFSWNLAHNVLSGVAYFLVWIWLWGEVRDNIVEAKQEPRNSGKMLTV